MKATKLKVPVKVTQRVKLVLLARTKSQVKRSLMLPMTQPIQISAQAGPLKTSMLKTNIMAQAKVKVKRDWNLMQVRMGMLVVAYSLREKRN